MASFLLLLDPDRSRREEAIAAFQRDGRIFSHLVGGVHTCGDAMVAWYTAPDAPVAVSTGGNAWVMGEPLDPEGTPLQPEAFAAGTTPTRGADGQFYAVRFIPEGVEVVTDTLGVLPVYYSQRGEVAAIATSPWASRLHPAFPPRLDPEGLAGVLLTNNIVNGRTVSAGCRRLAPGHRLVIHPPDQPREVREYRPMVSDRSYGLPKEECANILYEALEDAVRRHLRPDRAYTLLLSGGLDSRMVAALAHSQGIPVTALTMGRSTDQELRCARRVAAELGIAHRVLERRNQTGSLDRNIQWGGFTASPTSGGWADILTLELAAIAPRSTSGYLVDPVIGGSLNDWCYDGKTRAVGFEPYFARVCASGVGKARLGQLLRRDVFQSPIEPACDAVREEFRQAGETDLERAWWSGLTHRGRFHVGESMWRQAFGAWPSVPATDRRLMDTVLGFPLATLSKRQLQILAIRQRLPRLARLPRDRNSYDTTPLDPRLREVVRQALVNTLWEKVSRWSGGHIRRPERRYYRLLFDFNGPAWQTIRSDLEPHRQLAGELFHQEVFDEIVPPASVHWPQGLDAIAASGPKLLLMTLALLRWLENGASLQVPTGSPQE